MKKHSIEFCYRESIKSFNYFYIEKKRVLFFFNCEFKDKNRIPPNNYICEHTRGVFKAFNMIDNLKSTNTTFKRGLKEQMWAGNQINQSKSL